MTLNAIVGADIHDGTQLFKGMALLRDGATIVGIVAPHTLPAGCDVQELVGDVVTPGFVDLQVNGGGGLMFNSDPNSDTLTTIAAAHRAAGTAAILPTLITTTPEKTQAAIAAVRDAIAAGVPGILGLHLEGPHLAVHRKGAHDAALIRAMDDTDLAMIVDAAADLPNLMLTIAPESVSLEQVGVLSQAGVIIALGHTDADYETCVAYAQAGASCVTHLFNAMSQMSSRVPGLVGAALDLGRLSAGLIGDGIHVHPAAIRTALRAKSGPGQVFLVSDAMATLGSDTTEFDLDGRTIYRRAGRLTLADGTLAGADIDLGSSVRTLLNKVGVPLQQAIMMATSGPASVLKAQLGYGRLVAGKAPQVACLDSSLRFVGYV